MKVQKHDDCIWLSHLPAELQEPLSSLQPETSINVLINGQPTVWKRMREGRDGRSTGGLKVYRGAHFWRAIERGQPFELALGTPLLALQSEERQVLGGCISSNDPRIAELIRAAKRLARDYKGLTGRPLGVTGEVAEFEAARLMGADLCAAREAGYDALITRDGRRVRVQIKGRVTTEDSKPGQRVGTIKLKHPWDVVWFVSLDGDLEPRSIHEISRPRSRWQSTRATPRRANEDRSGSGNFKNWGFRSGLRLRDSSRPVAEWGCGGLDVALRNPCWDPHEGVQMGDSPEAGVFVIQQNGSLSELLVADFASEVDFQDLLANHPNLIPGSQVDPQSPRKWILVSRELGLGLSRGRDRCPSGQVHARFQQLPIGLRGSSRGVDKASARGSGAGGLLEPALGIQVDDPPILQDVERGARLKGELPCRAPRGAWPPWFSGRKRRWPTTSGSWVISRVDQHRSSLRAAVEGPLVHRSMRRK